MVNRHSNTSRLSKKIRELYDLLHHHKYHDSSAYSLGITFENLLTILPRGVVSKKDIGAYSTAESISLNRVRPALQDRRRAYSSLERANIAMPMLITT